MVKGKLKAHVLGRTSGQSRRVFAEMIAKMPSVTSIDHTLDVFLCPSVTVGQSPDEPCGFAAFVIDPKGPCIYVGGVRPREMPPEQWPTVIAENIAHEFAHYEQWRDGKPLTERGIAVRSRTLLRGIYGNQFTNSLYAARSAKGQAKPLETAGQKQSQKGRPRR